MKIDTYWHLIDQISAAVIILDDDGIVEHANQGSLDLLGFKTIDQVVGVGFEQFLAPENVRDYQESFWVQLQERDNLEFLCKLVRQDGSPYPISLVGALILDQSGTKTQTVLTLKELPYSQLTTDEFSYNKKLEDMQWLADQGRNLLSINHWPDILDIAGQALQEKLGDCLVFTFTKLDESSLRLEGVYGLEKNLFTQALNLIGGNLIGREFPIDKRYEDTYSSRHLYLHSDGLEKFARIQFPKKISQQLANMLGVEKIYTIGLEGIQQLMGCFYIFTLEPDLSLDQDLVESFTFQVALALEKTKYAEILELSEKKFQTIFEYAPDGYYLSDLQGNFIGGNLVAENITGYDREELIGKSFLSTGLISKDQIPRAGKLLAQNLLGISTGPDEFVLTRKDGSLIQVEITTHPVKLGDKSVVLGIARDISNRKKIEKNLEHAHESITRVLEGIDARVYVADMNNYEILYMNKKSIEDFGGDFTGRTCYESFQGKNKECSHCTNNSLVNYQGEPGEVLISEKQNIKTGHWYRYYDRAIYWTDQRLVKMQIAVDITESMKSSKALEQSEERYRSLFEMSHNAIMTLAPPSWTFESGNPTFIEMFGLENEDFFLTLKPWDLSPKFQPDGQKSKDKAREMIEVAVSERSHLFHWTFKRMTGEEFPATVQLTRVDHEGECYLQVTVRDITDQVKSEKILQDQMDDLTLINTLSAAANQGNDLADIFDLFSKEVKLIFNANSSNLFLLNEERDKVIVDYNSMNPIMRETLEKLNRNSSQQLEISLDKVDRFRESLNTGRVQILNSVEIIQEMMNEIVAASNLSQVVKTGIRNLNPKIYKRLGTQSVVFLPLRTAGNQIGLVLMPSTHRYTETDKQRFTSIAEQLSGIFQRVRAEKDRAVNLKEGELINRAFVEGSRIDDIDDICGHLAERIYDVNPGTYVMVTLYDPEVDAIRVRALTGLGNKADRLFKLMGKKPEDFLVNASQRGINPELNTLFTSGKIELVPDGLYDLTRGVVSRSICKSAEKLMGVDQVYIVGFGLGKMSIGGLVLFVKEGEKINHPTALETIVNHFAIIFERRQVQQEILERKVQLEALRDVELEITSQLNLEQLLFSIAEKQARL